MSRLFSLPKGRWVILAVLVMAVTPGFAHAQDANPILSIMAELLFTWLQAVAWLVSKLIDILILFCQVNSFYNHPIVLTGWNLVIQIANMMFLVALLVIAAGTVLNIQNYRYSRLLGNVILMALLVNFSRLIAGFFIQFSQIVMLTFVNSFKDALYGNFATMFGLDKVFELATHSGVDGTSSIVVAMIVSMMFLVMAGATIAAFIAIIVFRIVTLWVLLIISPMAYALAILPRTKKYADDWWGQFIDQLTRGPVIAFYLWLALAIVSQYPVDHPAQGWFPDMATQVAEREQSSVIQFANTFLSFENIVSFIVAMTFLLLGLQQATSASGAAGKWAKNASGFVGGALGIVSGANFVRERITQPIQGYWKNRQARTGAEIGERTAELDAGMAKLGSMTTGQLKRPLAAAGAVVGGLGKGTLDRVRGKSTLSAGQIIDQAAVTGDAALALGTRSLQQQQLRVKQAGEAQAARRSKEEDLTKLSPDQLLAKANTTSGESSLLYLNALAKGEKPVGRDAELLNALKRAGDINSPNTKKLIDTVRERDPKMAADAFYDGILDATGNFTEKFLKALKSDLSLTGLVRAEQWEQVNKKNDGAFANMLLAASRNEKEFKTAIDGIDERYRGDATKHIDLTGEDVETRKMVGKVTGQWGQVFNGMHERGADGSIQWDDEGKVKLTTEGKELLTHVKKNKKQFIDSLSVDAAKNTDMLLALGDTLSVKDYETIAERSDDHKKSINTGIAGNLDKATGVFTEGLYQRTLAANNNMPTYERTSKFFKQQETLRRAAFKASGGEKILHDLVGDEAEAGVKLFAGFIKGLKANDVKNVVKNAAFDTKNTEYNTDLAKEFRRRISGAIGGQMQIKEIGELASLGADQYELSVESVAQMVNKQTEKYLYMSKAKFEELKGEERKIAARARSLDSNEATGDLIKDPLV